MESDFRRMLTRRFNALSRGKYNGPGVIRNDVYGDLSDLIRPIMVYGTASETFSRADFLLNYNQFYLKCKNFGNNWFSYELLSSAGEFLKINGPKSYTSLVDSFWTASFTPEIWTELSKLYSGPELYGFAFSYRRYYLENRFLLSEAGWHTFLNDSSYYYSLPVEWWFPILAMDENNVIKFRVETDPFK